MLKRRNLLAATSIAGLGFPTILSAQPRNPSWPRALNMGTAAPGGTYAIFGPAWGQIVQEATGVNISYRTTQGPNQNIILTNRKEQIVQEATGVNISYRTTQGPNQNIILTNRKEVELGMVTMGVALQAWEGKGDWTQGNRFRDIRAIFPMYDTPFHGIALARSNITDHSHLNGKSVGVGPRGGTPGTYYPLILRALGVTPSAIRYGSASDLIGQVSDGLLDSFLFASGVPIPAFSELETTNQVRIFGFTPEQ
ncbi:MAG: hypothetical protein MUC89_22475, partial [Acetobacteraceae bacterium]|nr:hypothetical protein [Acetobacteraceae bacterium]